MMTSATTESVASDAQSTATDESVSGFEPTDVAFTSSRTFAGTVTSPHPRTAVAVSVRVATRSASAATVAGLRPVSHS